MFEGERHALLVGGRFKSCLVLSPLVSGRTFSRLPAGVCRTFEHASGGVSTDVVERVATSLIGSVAEIASFECPTFISRGARDRIVPYEVQVSLNQLSRSFVESAIQPDGRHCCHNIVAFVRPQLADWISLQLKEVVDA
jgi:2,6-dihydroxypseudooxynicotine hydrolase